jgi:adenylate cyclase, class 2
MAQETEIKLRITDLKAFERALKRLGARPVRVRGRVHEQNVIFDTPESRLAERGQLLRIRKETPERGRKARGAGKSRVLLTFKSPVERVNEALKSKSLMGRYKVREETELEVADAGTMAKILEGLGMRGWFMYEKYRTTYRLAASKRWGKGLLIELDETPIGTFVELEGPPEAIDQAAEELGFSKQDYILKNYLVLYMEECQRNGIQPKNMVFEEANKD